MESVPSPQVQVWHNGSGLLLHIFVCRSVHECSPSRLSKEGWLPGTFLGGFYTKSDGCWKKEDEEGKVDCIGTRDEDNVHHHRSSTVLMVPIVVGLIGRGSDSCVGSSYC